MTARVFYAVICWFVTALPVLILIKYYTADMPTLVSLWQRILYTTGLGSLILVVIVGLLYFWIWVWLRKY